MRLSERRIHNPAVAHPSHMVGYSASSLHRHALRAARIVIRSHSRVISTSLPTTAPHRRLSTRITMTNEHEDEQPTTWITESLTPHDVYYHGVRKLYMSATTAYQTMAIADVGAYGRALFLDGRIQLAERDEAAYHEPLLHAALVMRAAAGDAPKSVLIMGGGDGGAAREALRWRAMERVVCVDIDEAVVEGCKKHMPSIAAGAWDDPRCELIIGDALHYIARSTEQFDVAVSDLTDPVAGSQVLALFTVEHFRAVAARLAPGGALVVQGGALSLIESPIFPRVVHTLEQVFAHVRPAIVFPPTFGSPSGIIVATDSDAPLPPPDAIDRILKESLTSELRVLDGQGIHGMFAVPKDVKLAVARETEPITIENIPK